MNAAPGDLEPQNLLVIEVFKAPQNLLVIEVSVISPVGVLLPLNFRLVPN